MKKGQVMEAGTSDSIFNNPQEEYTRNLINSVPGMHLEIGTGSNLGLAKE